MSELIAWGARVPPDFRAGVRAMAERLKLDASWLMTLMAWETSRFGAAYRHGNDGKLLAAGRDFTWPENHCDGGGGLIGFTGGNPSGKACGNLRFHQAFPQVAAKDPVAQLADVEAYLRRWIGRVGRPDNVGDCYLLVRGPFGVGKGDGYPLGGGMTAGRAREIVTKFHAEGMLPANTGDTP